jgi:succinyl-diaminopimelate desuccinylase
LTPSDPVALTRALIRCPSVTPADEGAIDTLAAALKPLGFACMRFRFADPGETPVDNLYARLGKAGPNLCFAGHTDVVPPGDAAAWSVSPFAAEVRDGRLIGRGAVDMKGAIGAFVAAVARLLDRRHGPPEGSISLLITGDEEGPAVHGTARVLPWLAERGEHLDACLVGEPTGAEAVGDTVKIGRRGSLNAALTVHGVQGHIAYPQAADNPANRIAQMLAALLAETLDEGTAYFAPSSLQVSTIDVGNPATNVIPAQARALFNIRFNDRHSGASLKRRIAATLDRLGGRYDLDVAVSGEAFLSPPGPFTELVAAAVANVTGAAPALDTGGGTSDARFIKDYCPVVECGLVNRTAHKIDEQVTLDDLSRLTDIYGAILKAFFTAAR